MSAPKVSVVIPTYNCDRYLAEAIDSVLSQSYAEYEVIVVDDGSTDRTAEILQSYGDRIRHLRQSNQGVAIARNQGIQLAQGEWVAFLDADDFFLPDKLAAQMAIASACPDLGIIHSGWHRVDPQGQILVAVTPWQQIPRLDLESWLRWKPVLPSAMLFRRDWLMRSGGFDPRFPPAEDTDLVLRLARMGCSAEWLKQVTVGYRQHPESAMHQGLPQARSLTAVIDHFFAQPDLPESVRWLEPSVRYNTLVWIAWYLHYTGHPAEMVEYLRQSLYHAPFPFTEAIVHWADSFTAFAQNWGSQFDAETLARSAEWQVFMQQMIQDAGSSR
jgi:glycosyltransferase involved in cell wall biosynthesis